MPVSPRWPCVIHQTGYAISVPSPIATQPDFGGARATESYELPIEGGSGTLIKAVTLLRKQSELAADHVHDIIDMVAWMRTPRCVSSSAKPDYHRRFGVAHSQRLFSLTVAAKVDRNLNVTSSPSKVGCGLRKVFVTSPTTAIIIDFITRLI